MIRRLLLVAGVALAACAPSFQVRNYPTNAKLYAASLSEYSKKHWENAATGFEKLSLDLSARDTLLSRSHYYLGMAHLRHGDYLLAAQAFTRLAESFPDDTLAAQALLDAGDAYLKLWRNPSLDPQYGTLAQSQYRLLTSLYPDSPLSATAVKGSLKVDELMATKDFDTGVHYEKRKAFDSSIIYFKDVVRNFPNTQHARLAMIEMVKVYRRPEMNYKEEAAEMCNSLRGAYSVDQEVAKLCPVQVADSSARPVKPGR